MPGRAPAYLPEGYKKSTRTWRVDAPPGAPRGYQREHWDGRLDARIYPKPATLKLRREDD